MASLRNIFCRSVTKYEFLYKIRDIASSSQPINKKDEGKKHWRKTWEEQGEWQTSFKLFTSNQRSEFGLIRLIQSPIDLRLVAIRRWLRKKKREMDILEQSFIPKRHEILGTDLGAAHFILHRGGRIRFYNNDKWYVGQDCKIPDMYTPGFHVEAIDAANMNLYYEGLHNLYNLKYLKWLSFSNCQHIDDWCLDYVSGEFGQTLEYLDISNCQNITDRGLASLYRMKCLKFLNVSKIPTNPSFELACLLLEDLLTNLKIEGRSY